MTALGIGDAISSGPTVEPVSSVRAPGATLVPAGVGQKPALFPDDVDEGRWCPTPLDTVPCTRCGLRGHLAGDPDRCLRYRGSLGLGGQAAQVQGALL